jgi:hypothetical protein
MLAKQYDCGDFSSTNLKQVNRLCTGLEQFECVLSVEPVTAIAPTNKKPGFTYRNTSRTKKPISTSASTSTTTTASFPAKQNQSIYNDSFNNNKNNNTLTNYWDYNGNEFSSYDSFHEYYMNGSNSELNFNNKSSIFNSSARSSTKLINSNEAKLALYTIFFVSYQIFLIFF